MIRRIAILKPIANMLAGLKALPFCIISRRYYLLTRTISAGHFSPNTSRRLQTSYMIIAAGHSLIEIHLRAPLLGLLTRLAFRLNISDMEIRHGFQKHSRLLQLFSLDYRVIMLTGHAAKCRRLAIRCLAITTAWCRVTYDNIKMHIARWKTATKLGLLDAALPAVLLHYSLASWHEVVILKKSHYLRRSCLRPMPNESTALATYSRHVRSSAAAVGTQSTLIVFCY